MKDAKREILARVAAGTLTAEEAAVELGELDYTRHAQEPVATATASDVTRVRVVTNMGSVTVIGDESVREAAADGPHIARREGETIVIESDEDQNGIGFTFGGGRGRFGLDFKDWKLVVRMNPHLQLDAEVQAGSLTISGIHAPIHAEVQAGSTRIEDFTFPIDLDCQAGSVKARGRLTEGSSRISCQAGSVKLSLDPGSSVKVKAKTSLGRISLPGQPTVAGISGGHTEAQVGAGEATLEIESELGSVQVSVDG
ncbi:MAG: DUF4097 domain-containing protein [Candidatus Dormibacteraeota bacterium]|nr:DUF4097 domain-containing protein [Candidatus Dormibacteraeota bacterium]